MSEVDKNKVEIPLEEGTPLTGGASASKSSKTRLIVAAVVLVAVIIIIVVVTVVVVTNSSSSAVGTFEEPGKSCLELKNNGIHNSGYFYLYTDDKKTPFMAFCDMETDGGGWTLVATVYGSNATGSCANSSWYSSDMSLATRNWENKNVFGNVSIATSSDYKNSAYFSLQASDVMVRIVPNNQPVKTSKENSTLEYYTDNNFLKNLGGNLYQVFSEHYPLNPTNVTSDDPVLEKMLDSLNASSDRILDLTFPKFYEYVYDDATTNRLTNGGNNLFDPYGMEVTATTPNCSWTLDYGQTYKCAAGNTTVSSRKSYPFFALLNTGDVTIPDSYKCTIDSKRPNSDKKTSAISSAAVKNGNFTIGYYTDCRLSNNIPSYCDIKFTVYNEEEWNSIPVNRSGGFFPSNEGATHANAVYGYTMVAREPGDLYQSFPIEELVARILNVIARFPTINIEAMLDELAANRNLLNITYPEYYHYVYDDVRSDRLTNGGNDLFNPYGMEITAELPSHDLTINYSQSYRLFEKNAAISSKKSYPFFALMKQENPRPETFAGFMARSGYYRGDVLRSFSSSIIYDSNPDYKMKYDATCRYSDTTPSVCDVIFVITNEQKWNSVSVSSLKSSVIRTWDNNITGTEYPFLDVTDYSVDANAIVGYTLVAREPGNVNTLFPLSEIMSNIRDVFTQFPSIASYCGDSANNLVVPIKYTIGGNKVSEVIPSYLQPFVSTGYLQLRALNYRGTAYSLCPTGRVSTCDVEQLCLGGVSDETQSETFCNNNSGDEAASNNQSTVMIFYR